MIKACIFDLDGTLSDSLESMAYTANRALSEEGLKELPTANFRYYAGNGAKELVRGYLRDTERLTEEAAKAQASKYGVTLNPDAAAHDPHNEASFDYYYDIYMREFAVYCTYKVKPYAGIPEVLRALKARGMKLAVCSNKPDHQAKDVIKDLFGEGLFDEVHGQRPGVPRKPSPAGPLQIAAAFSVQPSECLYFGDTNTDMQTGKSAGMHTIGVLWGFRDRAELEANHADGIVEKPSDILNLL